MLKVAVAQCEGIDARYVAHTIAEECLRQLAGSTPTVGILFANDEFNHQDLLQEVYACLPAMDLVGCCTAGEISSVAGFSDDSVCLMLICADQVETGSGFGEFVSIAPENAAKAAVSMARAKLLQKEKLCLVFGDGLVGKHTGIIAYLNRELADSCGIFGGMSGLQRYHYNELKTSQFFGNRVLHDSVVILLLAGDIEYTHTLCNSWNPIGESTIITATEDNTVTRIGERSALDFYRSYLGPHSHPATENPFAIYEEGQQAYFLRVPTGYDEQSGSISFPVPLPLGAKIQITESSRKRALSDIRTTLVGAPQIKADLAFIFSCDIRKNIFGTRAFEEWQTINDCLPLPVPTIGFYTLGEVAPLYPGGKSIVHHCTLVVLLIRMGGHGHKIALAKTEAPRNSTTLSHSLNIQEEIRHSIDFLERQLKRERFYRKSLEDNKEIIVTLFRKLNQELLEKNQELLEIRLDLERRVDERTEDLVKANTQLQSEIAERIRTFEQKEALEKQLHQAQRMESMGILAGGIAHDFNNILTPILGYTEMVIRDLPREDAKREDLLNVLKAGKRAKKLIQQILLFSREQELELQPLKIQAIIKETMKLLRSSIPTTIEFRQTIDPECGYIMTDPTQIHQVLMNLCTNASHAMEESGGVLDIQLTRAEITTSPTSQHLQPGSYLHLSIGDTGCGMDQDVLERIFDPYFTTKEKGKGTGLGLSVTHGIVQKHNGTIFAESKLGFGTTFHIYIPLLSHETAVTEEKVSFKKLATGSEHILLVDDEVMIVEMYRTILERLGYRVTVETNSKVALKRFLAEPDAFQLAILDHTMPGLTGEKMARTILQHRPEMPIILSTGYSALISEDEAIKAGIRRCLAKPISMKELTEAIREVIDAKKPL